MALPQSVPLTVEDLEAMPDDGHRYELVDGTLIVTPAPLALHQRAVLKLAALLLTAAGDDLDVLPAPFDYQVSQTTLLQPDIIVLRRQDLRGGRLAGRAAMPGRWPRAGPRRRRGPRRAPARRARRARRADWRRPATPNGRRRCRAADRRAVRSRPRSWPARRRWPTPDGARSP